MRINTNVTALNAHRQLTQSGEALGKSIGRLSSGLRINRASDDAAGLGIANRLRADVRSLRQASANAEQANSVLQVMEGATAQISGILERMKELASQSNSASSGADSGAAKTQLNAEFTTLISELDRIVATTTFNGQTLLAGGFGSSVNTAVGTSTVFAAGTGVYGATINGTAAGTYDVDNSVAGTITISLGSTSQSIAVGSDGAQDVAFSTFGITLQLDANYTAAGTAADGDLVVAATASGSFMVSSSGAYAGNDLVSINAIDVDSTTLGINGDTIDTAGNAQTALANLDTAISRLSTAVGVIGSAQGRISYAQANVRTTIENTAAAESVIRDVDMAAEVTNMTKYQILQQAGTAVLAQANSMPQTVLSLLR